LKHGADLSKNLQVDARAMAANIARANDVILAEAAVFALAKTMPRQEAEELVKKACAAAIAENNPLIEVVKRLAQGKVPGGRVDWRALARPENYLGETEKLIDRVLAGVETLLHGRDVAPL
jgi:3-carboxy-cis,cis-muconate cycloisomerase